MEQNSKDADVDIAVRRGTPEDAADFCKFVSLSSTTFYPMYGDSGDKLMTDLFVQPQNLCSREHTYFAEVKGEIAGMVLGYSWKDMISENRQTSKMMRDSLKTNFYLKFFNISRVYKIFENKNEDEFRLINIAVYPEFRGMGLAQKLISRIENEAKMKESKKIALDVRVDNEAAIGLYRKAGFIIDKTYPSFKLENENLEFYKMVKILS